MPLPPAVEALAVGSPAVTKQLRSRSLPCGALDGEGDRGRRRLRTRPPAGFCPRVRRPRRETAVTAGLGRDFSVGKAGRALPPNTGKLSAPFLCQICRICLLPFPLGNSALEYKPWQQTGVGRELQLFRSLMIKCHNEEVPVFALLQTKQRG